MSWDTPKWKSEGRVGPGAFAPKKAGWFSGGGGGNSGSGGGNKGNGWCGLVLVIMLGGSAAIVGAIGYLLSWVV